MERGRALVLSLLLTVLSVLSLYFYSQHRKEEEFREVVERVLSDSTVMDRYIKPVIDCTEKEVVKEIEKAGRYTHIRRKEFYNLSDVVDVKPAVYRCAVKVVERNEEKLERELGTEDKTLVVKAIGSISYGYVSKRLVVYEPQEETFKIL